MEILERPNSMRKGFAPLDNIGYFTFEVSLEGEVYTFGIPNKVERVGSNRWKIRKYDFSGNPIECVIRTDALVGFAWYNIDEKLWENSTYADIIRRCKEFFSVPYTDKDKTKYKTSNGFSYYVTKEGEVWNTEKMAKIKGSVDQYGYLHVTLGSALNVKVHRLVAHYFVPIPKDLSEESLVVNHLDGNKLNNRSDNLEWTTQKGNLEHASINGLLHTAIDDQLLERIWQLLEEGYTDTAISKLTGVPADTVNDIRHGTSLRYRTDKYTWPKSSVAARRKKERRDELAMKCVQMFNEGMTYKAIADKLGFISKTSVFKLIDTHRDLITRKLPRTRLDKDTIRSIYNDFMYTDMSNSEISRKYNVSRKSIADLRRGSCYSNLAREYINSKGLDRYWKGYNPPPK